MGGGGNLEAVYHQAHEEHQEGWEESEAFTAKRRQGGSNFKKRYDELKAFTAKQEHGQE
jgi:hypothetical protein